MTEPLACPFTDEAGEKATRPIPEHMQAALASLFLRRSKLNKRPEAPVGNSGAWHREAAPIFAEIKALEDELRKIVDAPLPSCIDYYAGWRFRCIC